MLMPPRRIHKRAGVYAPLLFAVRKRFKSGGTSAPPSVDPNALAQSQAQANVATANAQSSLNNVRTTSPIGYSDFEQDPSGRWNLSQTLSPQTQGVFNNQVSLAQQLAGTGSDLSTLAASPALAGANIVDNAYNTLGSQIPTGPVSLDGLPSIATSAGPSGNIQMAPDFNNLPPSVSNVNAGQIQNNVGDAGPIQSNVAGAGPLQNSYNFSGLPALPTSSTDFSSEVQQAQNAAYNAQTQYLDPQFAEKQSDLTQQLADQGIAAGSDAFSRSTGDLARQQQQAYQGAQDAAVAAGNQEQANLFGENLSSRQQGANEAIAQGQFGNAAQGQQYGENLAGGQFTNAAQGQQYGQNLQSGQFTNAAQQQDFGQGLQNAQLSDTARQAEAQLALEGQSASNQAQQQNYGQNLTNAQLSNQGQQQGFNERTTQWGQPLSALTQAAQTGEGILGSAVGNTTGLSPLSDFAWGGSVPTFGGSPTAVAPANVVGAQSAANQANANQFTAANTLNNQLFNGLGSLGGALGLGNGGLSTTLFGAGGVSGLFGAGAGSDAALGAGFGAGFGGGGAALGIPDFLGLAAL